MTTEQSQPKQPTDKVEFFYYKDNKGVELSTSIWRVAAMRSRHYGTEMYRKSKKE